MAVSAHTAESFKPGNEQKINEQLLIYSLVVVYSGSNNDMSAGQMNELDPSCLPMNSAEIIRPHRFLIC